MLLEEKHCCVITRLHRQPLSPLRGVDCGAFDACLLKVSPCVWGSVLLSEVCVCVPGRSVWFGLFDLACSVQCVYNGTFHYESLAFFSALKVGVLHTLGQLLLCVCVCIQPRFAV